MGLFLVLIFVMGWIVNNMRWTCSFYYVDCVSIIIAIVLISFVAFYETKIKKISKLDCK